MAVVIQNGALFPADLICNVIIAEIGRKSKGEFSGSPPKKGYPLS
jgi:hypothetical protein